MSAAPPLPVGFHTHLADSPTSLGAGWTGVAGDEEVGRLWAVGGSWVGVGGRGLSWVATQAEGHVAEVTTPPALASPVLVGRTNESGWRGVERCFLTKSTSAAQRN